MKTLTRSALVARPPEQVYALVNDIGNYPRFVPGCSAAEILMRNEQEIVARLKVHRAGPLRALHGLWTFTPVASNGCRIELQLQFEFSNPFKAALLEPLIEGTATSMVHAFVARAQQGHA